MRIADMRPNDVIAEVNGVSITKGDFDLLCDLQGELYRLRTGKKRGDDSVRSYVRYQKPTLPMTLIKCELFRQGAKKHGISLNAKRLEANHKAFLMRQNAGKTKFGDYLKKLGSERAALLDRMMRDEVLAMDLCRLLCTNDFTTVTDAQIDAYEKKVEKFDSRSKKKNASAMKKALSFRARVVNGEDFAAVAKKCAQVSPEYAEEWQTVQLGELEADSALAKWLATAKAGDISNPIDLDDGLAVVKVVSRTPADVPDGAEPVDDFKLVRCTFYAYEYAIRQPRPEIRKMLLGEQREIAFREVGVRLFKEANVKYPNGTDFFAKKQKKGAK